MRLPALVSVACVLGGTALAGADPCAVTLHAPDDARGAIEAWVAAEPACGPALTVHVVRTASGFLLTASDTSGRTYQRVVPDAQTAAALVASWAADDQLDGGDAGRGEAGAIDPDGRAGPVLAAAAGPPNERPDLDAGGGTRWRRSSTVDAAFGRESGVRIASDLYVRGHWSLGLAAMGQAGTLREYGAERDLKVLATAGYGASWRGFDARVAVGAGVQITSLSESNMAGATGQVWAAGTTAIVATEASLTIRREIGAGISIEVGGVLSVLPSSAIEIAGMSVREDLGHVAQTALLGLAYRW